MLMLPDRIRVTEVAPRDGLQSFPKWVDTDVKVAMINRLSAAGFPVIEVTSFAHPRVVPNLRDAEEVCAHIQRRPGTTYRALVPNARGATRAVAAKVDEMLGLITVSASYLRHNQNMTVDETVDQAVQSFHIAEAAGISFVMALGMSMWCPYEGVIPEQNVHELVRRFRAAGMRRFYLAGSMGMEDARQVNYLFGSLGDCFRDCEFGYHVHNLSGQGTANVLAAIDGGAHWIEGSICGIGGGVAMPENVGSIGNLPTEDIVAMFHEMGIDTGLELDEVIAAARDIIELLNIEPMSHVLTAGTRASLLSKGRRQVAGST